MKNRIAPVIVTAVTAAAGLGTAALPLATAASPPAVSASVTGFLASGNTPWGGPSPVNPLGDTPDGGNTPWG
jgi:hypothetical protein